ncbi:hypothetical protein BDW72DRAFT_147949 [Aspergillus terricola var. indicus]
MGRQHEPVMPDKECRNMRLSIIISREEFLTPRENTMDFAESARLEEPQILYAAAAPGMRKVQMLTDLEFQSTMVSGLLALNLRDGLERANQSNIRVSDHCFSIQVILSVRDSSDLFSFVFLPLQSRICRLFPQYLTH